MASRFASPSGRLENMHRRPAPRQPRKARGGPVMKVYLLSLGAGLLVGVIYSLLQVRSPAPPLIALVGLLGILAGEQILPVGKQIIAGKPWRSACASVG